MKKIVFLIFKIFAVILLLIIALFMQGPVIADMIYPKPQVLVAYTLPSQSAQTAAKQVLHTKKMTFFDVDSNGFAEHTSWIGKNAVFLGRDINKNGAFDAKSELFHASDGRTAFEHLALLDGSKYGGNEDGILDARDANWKTILTWDGRLIKHQLIPLSAYGITGILLKTRGLRASVPLSKNRIKRTAKWSAQNSQGHLFEIALHANYMNTWYFGDDITKSPEINDLFSVVSLRSRGLGRVKSLQLAIDENAELRRQVGEFMELDLESQCNQIDQRVSHILLEWMNVEYDKKTPDISFAQKREMIAAITNKSANSKLLWLKTSLLRSNFQRGWDKVYAEYKYRFLIHGPFRSVFRKSAYRWDTDSVIHKRPFEKILADAVNFSPTQQVAAECYWHTLEEIFLHGASALNKSPQQIKTAFAKIAPQYASTTLPKDPSIRELENLAIDYEFPIHSPLHVVRMTRGELDRLLKSLELRRSRSSSHPAQHPVVDTVNVTVHPSNSPFTIALLSHSKTLWNITNHAGKQLKAVIIGGKDYGQIKGLDSSIPVLQTRLLSGPNPRDAIAPASIADATVIESLQIITGNQVSTFASYPVAEHIVITPDPP